MTPLTPQVFLSRLSGGLAGCEFLSPLDALILRERVDACLATESFGAVSRIAREYAFLLAQDFLGRLQGPVAARLLGPDGADRPIAQDKMPDGLPLRAGFFPADEFVIEVRCRTGAFHRARADLPSPGNWEIALRELEEGFEDYGRLVVFGGFGGKGRWVPSEDRPMAFRMPSPGLVVRKMRGRRPESAFDPVYIGGLATFRDYEDAMGRNEWPVGLPVERLPVDDEGDQHGLYFLYHDLGHGTIRSRRPKPLRDAARAVLRAGLEVFPEVDGVSPQTPQGEILGRLFGRLVELKTVYFADQLLEEIRKTETAFRNSGPDLEDRRRLERFKGELRRIPGFSRLEEP